MRKKHGFKIVCLLFCLMFCSGCIADIAPPAESSVSGYSADASVSTRESLPGEEPLALPDNLSEEEEAIYRFAWGGKENKPFLTKNGELPDMGISVADFNLDGRMEYIVTTSNGTADIPVNEVFQMQNGILVSMGGFYGRLYNYDEHYRRNPYRIPVYRTSDGRRVVVRDVDYTNGGSVYSTFETDIDTFTVRVLWEMSEPYDYDPDNLERAAENKYYRRTYYLRPQSEFISGSSDARLSNSDEYKVSEQKYTAARQEYWDSLTAAGEMKIMSAASSNFYMDAYVDIWEENQRIADQVCKARLVLEGPGKLYIYSNPANPAKRDDQYGLINRDGKFVLPPQPNYIYNPQNIESQSPAIQEQAYFVMIEGTGSKLISPTGEILTGADFAGIFATANPDRHVGVKKGWNSEQEAGVLWIDADGSLHECDDQKFLHRLWLWHEEVSRQDQIEPYIPDFIEGAADSFDMWQDVLSLETGDEVSVQECSIIGLDRYIVELYVYPQGDYSQTYNLTVVCNSRREFLTGESYRAVLYGHSYFVGILENETAVYDLETLREICRYPEAPAKDYPHSQYVIYEGGVFLQKEDNPNQIIDLITGELLEFSGVALPDLKYASADGQILEFYDQNNCNYVYTRQGQILYQSELWCSLCVQGDYIISWLAIPTHANYFNYLHGVMSFDGQEVLPQEFSYIKVLDRDLFLVVRGDSAGVMDSRGDWIYRESVYQYLED